MSNTIEVRAVDPFTLKPSPVNKRTFHKDDAKDPKIVELSQNIARDGQVQPIVIRPVNGHKEIVCGERRTRACRLLRRDVLAIERELDDKQAAMLTAAENAEREDLNAVEEAETFQALLDQGWTHAEIADHLGRPLSHIIKRVQLTQLSPKWREIATDTEGFTRAWNGVHFEKIAKFPGDVQDSILQDLKEYDLQDVSGWTTKMLAGHLAQFLQSIDNAPWKKDDETLVVKAGACKACKKRSDCQPDLFDDEDLVDTDPFGNTTGKVKKGARCLDPDCWDAKMVAYLAQRETELKEKHNKAPLILADNEYRVNNSDDHPYKGRAKAAWNVTPCKQSDKGAVAALYVDGPKQGQVVHVKERREESNYPDSRAKAKPTGEKSLKDKRLNLEMLRSRIVASKLIDLIRKKPSAPSAWTNEEKMALLLTFGTPPGYLRWDQTYGEFSKLENRPIGELADALYEAALPVIANCLHQRINSSNGTNPIEKDFLVNTCDVLDADYDTLYAQACEEKKEPKSWAKEEANAKDEKKPAKAKADAKPKSNGKAKPAKKPGKAKKKATK